MEKMGGLTYKSATRDPPYLVQNECESSTFDHWSILMKARLWQEQKLLPKLLRKYRSFPCVLVKQICGK